MDVTTKPYLSESNYVEVRSGCSRLEVINRHPSILDTWSGVVIGHLWHLFIQHDINTVKAGMCETELTRMKDPLGCLKYITAVQ